MGGREISALLVGNSYFRAVLEKQPPLHDLNADRTAAINGTLRTPTPLEGTIRPTNDVFPERIPPPSADERPETPLTDYPETEEEVVGASQPHRRHVLSWNPNRRRNTSAALLFKKNGEQMCAVIDCGKNFYEAALEHFPKNGLRRIDALMITHGHADACFGLDDLRQWTIGPEGYRTQHAIDVYLNEETLGVVQGAFPYLVDKKLATGGGDVTSLR